MYTMFSFAKQYYIKKRLVQRTFIASESMHIYLGEAALNGRATNQLFVSFSSTT